MAYHSQVLYSPSSAHILHVSADSCAHLIRPLVRIYMQIVRPFLSISIGGNRFELNEADLPLHNLSSPTNAESN